MTTDFSPIKNAISSLTDAMASIHNDLLAKANAERVEALVLFAKMRETQRDLFEFSGIVGAAADELTSISKFSDSIGMLVTDVIDEGADALPDVDYEDFVGFCAGCGATIADGDGFSVIENEMFCDECAPCVEEEDEAEAEQMTIDDVVTE